MTGGIAYPRGMLMASTFCQIILRVDSDLTAEDKINKVIDAVWLEGGRKPRYRLFSFGGETWS
jgi:hypothetical protein